MLPIAMQQLSQVWSFKAREHALSCYEHRPCSFHLSQRTCSQDRSKPDGTSSLSHVHLVHMTDQTRCKGPVEEQHPGARRRPTQQSQLQNHEHALGASIMIQLKQHATRSRFSEEAPQGFTDESQLGASVGAYLAVSFLGIVGLLVQRRQKAQPHSAQHQVACKPVSLKVCRILLQPLHTRSASALIRQLPDGQKQM